MNNDVNIYCDESCYLENDGINVMSIGAIWIEKQKSKEALNRIKEIKLKNGLKNNYELKWTKISPNHLDVYMDEIDYFFDDDAFKSDFIDSETFFRGIRLGLKRHPEIDGKVCTFWHFISDGKDENNRLPDIRRCERIKWPKPIIEHEICKDIKIWENRRHNEIRILLFCEPVNYLVVLAKRKKYILPWTAYLVEREHRKRKLLNEYKKARASSNN